MTHGWRQLEGTILWQIELKISEANFGDLASSDARHWVPMLVVVQVVVLNKKGLERGGIERSGFEVHSLGAQLQGRMNADAFAVDNEFPVDQGLAENAELVLFGVFGAEVDVYGDGLVWEEGSESVIWLNVNKLWTNTNEFTFI